MRESSERIVINLTHWKFNEVGECVIIALID